MDQDPKSGKNWYRCNVCNDVHYGFAAPEICPTCGYRNAYIQVTLIEAQATGKIVVDAEEIKKAGPESSKDSFIELLDDFARDKEFELNPDTEFMRQIVDGILMNESATGLKFCPCRLRTEDLSYNLTLLCPCNFGIQETYATQGRCWCGLFTKRDQVVDPMKGVTS